MDIFQEFKGLLKTQGLHRGINQATREEMVNLKWGGLYSKTVPMVSFYLQSDLKLDMSAFTKFEWNYRCLDSRSSLSHPHFAMIRLFISADIIVINSLGSL